MAKYKLLPCPFCGGKPEMERIGNAKQSMIIACENCGCRLESGDVCGMTSERNLAWNQRRKEEPADAE